MLSMMAPLPAAPPLDDRPRLRLDLVSLEEAEVPVAEAGAAVGVFEGVDVGFDDALAAAAVEVEAAEGCCDDDGVF